MLLWIPAALAGETPAAPTRETTVAFQVGADINASPHGLLTVEARRRDVTLGLYTDTVQLRWDPSLETGRAWLAARSEFGVAGLMPSPWTDGAPDPTRAMMASYAGPEGGVVRYLPRGTYAGVDAAARYWWFADTATTEVDLLDPRWVLSGSGFVGWWTDEAQLVVRAGVDRNGTTWSPRVSGELTARPERPLGPRLELRGQVADAQDEVLLARVGGLNPYVVPLAGAGWGEFWMEDYLAARAGGGWRGPIAASELRIDAVADIVTSEGVSRTGLGLDGGWSKGRWSVDVAGGYSPFIARQEGVGAWSAWLAVGRGHP
ncbi:MAG: hypothetical protein GY913_01560 [Proteobacteria bacterium]|nr:hypothetical protein [Pseudomonadota bacterium]MCP4915586.1 hypothetical protein [Pseudomonadota bacterium]